MRCTVRIVLFAILTFVAGCGVHRTAASAAQERGRAVYARECAACHGVAGGGAAIGPSLKTHRGSLAQIEAIVRDPEPPMPKLYPARLSDADVRDVSRYVESL